MSGQSDRGLRPVHDSARWDRYCSRPHTPSNCDGEASWSPDARRILDSACHRNLGEDNIFLVSADGSRTIRVTRA